MDGVLRILRRLKFVLCLFNSSLAKIRPFFSSSMATAALLLFLLLCTFLLANLGTIKQRRKKNKPKLLPESRDRYLGVEIYIFNDAV